MKEIAIQNKELLSILDEFLWFYQNIDDLDPAVCTGLDHIDERNHYMSDEYCKSIQAQGTAHEGFPEMYVSYSFVNMDYRRPADRFFPKEWIIKWFDIRDRLMKLLSVRNAAAAALYPPDRDWETIYQQVFYNPY